MDFDPRDYDSREEDRFNDREGSARAHDARDLGRGPGDSREEERWPERDRGGDPREAFTRDLNLPRGLEREIVRDRDRDARASNVASLAASRRSCCILRKGDRPTLRAPILRERWRASRLPSSRRRFAALTHASRSRFRGICRSVQWFVDVPQFRVVTRPRRSRING
jgi:hypothetical protein